jgi:hypothetical protein
MCDPDDLQENFKMNCIPEGMETRELEDYDDVLEERRKLMAQRIKTFYQRL